MAESAQISIDLPPVLDACCGPRMFWFDSADKRALFIDKRQETHAMDLGTRATRGRAPAVIAPDVVADFTALPFPDESFYLVVFDPPHIMRHRGGLSGCFSKKYGMLPSKWPEVLRAGFAECFRVLKPNGTLVFKWADTNIPVSQVLMATPERPLFGSRRGAHTHWYVFTTTSPFWGIGEALPLGCALAKKSQPDTGTTNRRYHAGPLPRTDHLARRPNSAQELPAQALPETPEYLRKAGVESSGYDRAGSGRDQSSTRCPPRI